MSIRFSVSKFPRDPSIRDATGLPWGCTLQPFSFAADGDSSSSSAALSPGSLALADDVARCEDCYAYINPLCQLNRATWRCSLCQVVNTFSDDQLARYYGPRGGGWDPMKRCPELMSGMVDLDVATGDADVAGDDDMADGTEDNNPWLDSVFAKPVFIAMVDVGGTEEFLELVKSSLLAALEALHPAALFGLITVGQKIGVYDLRGSIPTVKYVSVPSDPDKPLPLALQDVMPLQAFLANVSEHKENIAAAFESLCSATPLPAIIPPGQVPGSSSSELNGRSSSSSSNVPSEVSGSTASALGSPAEPEMAAAGAGGSASSSNRSGSEQQQQQTAIDFDPAADAKRAFGAAVKAVIEYLAAGEEGGAAGSGGEGDAAGGRGGFFGSSGAATSAPSSSSYVCARISIFLSGLPNYGKGQLDSARYVHSLNSSSSIDDSDRPLFSEQTPLYRELAAQAVQIGVCFDIYAITPSYCDLASLKSLCTDSGGGVFWYGDPDDATLPQDIYRTLSRPKALSGVLRLRTSREFRPVRASGHFFPDSQFEDLFHVICCDPYDTFAFDFEFTSPAGFAHLGSYSATGPVLQMAFQYTVILPVSERSEEEVAGKVGELSLGNGSHGEEAGEEGRKGGRLRCSLRRRLRVKTVSVQIARSPREMYEAADNDAIIATLMHKIIQASIEEGVKEGRLLLQDWLVILTAHYNDTFKLATFGVASSIPRLDVAFVACPNLQPIPRLVFAMLRSPLLKFQREGVHPDQRVFLQTLFSSMDPTCLSRVIYPTLSSYLTPDKPAFPRHSLSRAALVTSGSPIFLLDAYTTIVVFYSPAAPPDLPFPPPQNSLIRTTINKMKADRNVTPRTIMIHGASDKTDVFESFLVEEQDVNGREGFAGMGFVAFLESVAGEVREYMK